MATPNTADGGKGNEKKKGVWKLIPGKSRLTSNRWLIGSGGVYTKGGGVCLWCARVFTWFVPPELQTDTLHSKNLTPPSHTLTSVFL